MVVAQEGGCACHEIGEAELFAVFTRRRLEEVCWLVHETGERDVEMLHFYEVRHQCEAHTGEVRRRTGETWKRVHNIKRFRVRHSMPLERTHNYHTVGFAVSRMRIVLSNAVCCHQCELGAYLGNELTTYEKSEYAI